MNILEALKRVKFSCVFLLLAQSALGQSDVQNVIKVRAMKEVKLMIDPDSKFGLGEERGWRRTLVIRGAEFAKDCAISRSLKGFDVELRIAFLNKAGSESAGVVENKDDWSDIPDVNMELGIPTVQLEKLLAILLSKEVTVKKRTFIRKNIEGEVMLFSKDLSFSLIDSQIDLLAEVVGLYFADSDPNKLSFMQRNGVVE